MRRLSIALLANAVMSQRKAKRMTQEDLCSATGINRTMIGRIERQDYMPTVRQLESICDVLDIKYESLLEESCSGKKDRRVTESYRIAVAGTGYVGLSLAVLLSQYNQVTAVDVIPEKVDKINRRESPIIDKEIQQFLSERTLDLSATLDAESAYRNGEGVRRKVPYNCRKQDVNLWNTIWECALLEGFCGPSLR
ncbi:MAG TPA: helix-turn-helix domain-containing protein [Spirochaetales bacterium]|nr:helix-turn-helix domain-containing protein [Spirochaetales bacterium]